MSRPITGSRLGRLCILVRLCLWGNEPGRIHSGRSSSQPRFPARVSHNVLMSGDFARALPNSQKNTRLVSASTKSKVELKGWRYSGSPRSPTRNRMLRNSPHFHLLSLGIKNLGKSIAHHPGFKVESNQLIRIVPRCILPSSAEKDWRRSWWFRPSQSTRRGRSKQCGRTRVSPAACCGSRLRW